MNDNNARSEGRWSAKWILAASIWLFLCVGWAGLRITAERFAAYPHGDLVIVSGADWYDSYLLNKRISQVLDAIHTPLFLLILVGMPVLVAMVCGWLPETPIRKIALVRWFVIAVGVLTFFSAISMIGWHRPYHGPAKNFCENKLRALEGAKEMWAIKHKKTATDTPRWQDLVGRDKWLKIVPECPNGGRYTIGNLAVKPACSIPGHTR